MRVKALRKFQWIALLVGCACLGYYTFATLHRVWFQWRAEQEFHAPTSPLAKPKRIDPIVGRLEAPDIGLSVMVLRGVDDATLNAAAGHIPGTSLPGMSGNIAIAGHRDTIFRPLRNLKRRDRLRILTRNGAYEYEVEAINIVKPDDVSVLRNTAKPTLTLVTCFPFTFVGHAPKRWIVRARQIASFTALNTPSPPGS